jgi:mono/diheme cytochrome c family protein
MACTGDSKNATETVQGPNTDRGRRLYLINCISCHNRDSAKTGATGPAIKGSSNALLEAKILHKRYPSAYVPKRKSSAMPAFPHLKKAIPDLAAYLR